MRIGGKKVEGPSVEVVVIPRETGDIVFKCKAVLDYTEFEKLCPEPVPPMVTRRGEKAPSADFDDKDFKVALRERALKRFSWMVLTSLSATEGLEWDKVKLNDPSTWSLLEDELAETGFLPREISSIIEGVTVSNGLNEERLQEARKRFFESQKLGQVT